MIGLCFLLKEYPDHPDAASWKEAIRIFCKNYLEEMSTRSAFGIVPYGFFSNEQKGNRRIGKYWYRWFMERQRRAGSDSERWWVGINANLASAGVVFIKAADLLDDPSLKALAQRQLDWIVGVNPYNASTVSGVGYNQPRRYIPGAFDPPTPNIPGAVMNGIGGSDDDEPDIYPGSWQTCEYWTPMLCYTMWLEAEIQKSD